MTKEIKKEKKKEKRSFFCICDECGKKIYKHQGYREHPKGVFVVFVTCPHCEHQFNHIIRSKEGKINQQANKQLPVAIKVLKKMGMGGAIKGATDEGDDD